MRPGFLAIAVAGGLAAVAAAGGRPSRTTITVYSGSAGGGTYGGIATGAYVIDRREVDLVGGELRLEGVSGSLDPASVQLRDLGDPGLAVVQQRFATGATTPTEMLAHHLGDPVTVGTAKGDTSGVLRGVDDTTLAIEVGGTLELIRRDYVQTMRLPGGGERASLAWKVSGAKPGKHALEVSYRTDGLAWSADYVAVVDAAAATVDFSALATIRNETGTSFDDAQLTLVGAGTARFEVPGLVHLAGSDAVQLEMMPTRRGAKGRAIVAVDASTVATLTSPIELAQDCTPAEPVVGEVQQALELEAGIAALPDGHVRIFKRVAEHLEPLGEDDFHPTPGRVRLRLAGEPTITSSRVASKCDYDEPGKTLREHVDIALQSTSKAAQEIVVRDFLWRGLAYKLEKQSVKSTQLAPQQHEFRVRVPAGGRQVISYDIVYSW